MNIRRDPALLEFRLVVSVHQLLPLHSVFLERNKKSDSFGHFLIMVLHQYDYIFALGTIFSFLDAWNIGKTCYPPLNHPSRY
jgi:hypothetical protein